MKYECVIQDCHSLEEKIVNYKIGQNKISAAYISSILLYLFKHYFIWLSDILQGSTYKLNFPIWISDHRGRVSFLLQPSRYEQRSRPSEPVSMYHF